MAESGCVKNVSVENLDVLGSALISGKLQGFKIPVLRQTVFTTSKNLSVTESGSLILFDKDEASTVTLPQITENDIGISYTFLETVVSDYSRKIVTKFDNDYLVGGVTNLFDGAVIDDADTGSVKFLSTGSTDTTINLSDDDLANSGGGIGATVTCTAILTGTTGAGGGAKLVWSVTGSKIAQAATDTGAAFFS